jgi:hypothetical protein
MLLNHGKTVLWLVGLTLLQCAATGAQQREKSPPPLREEPLLAAEAATLRHIPLGLTVRNEDALPATSRLRPGDHVIIGATQFAAIHKLPKGVIKILFLHGNSAVPDSEEWRKAVAAADMLSLDDTRDVEAAKFLRKTADQFGKKVLLAPTGVVAEAVGRDMAPYGDVFLIQAQHWLQEDTSRELGPFCDKVHQLATEFRKANPKLQIWVQVGRRLDRGGGNAGLFVHAFARLKATHPEDLQTMHPFIGGGSAPKPGHGRAALEQFLDAIRPKGV